MDIVKNTNELLEIIEINNKKINYIEKNGYLFIEIPFKNNKGLDLSIDKNGNLEVVQYYKNKFILGFNRIDQRFLNKLFIL